MNKEQAINYLKASGMSDEQIKTLIDTFTCEDCISRKETIEWLKKVTVTDGITFKTGFEQILYDIEQMPSVTPSYNSIKTELKSCDDCISRDDVFETYSVLYDVFDENPNICNELHKVFVKLNKLPSVTPQPKVGKWMRKTKVDGVYDIAGVKTWGIKCQCDRCDFTTTVIENFGYYNYCPNCGAKMEVEE